MMAGNQSTSEVSNTFDEIFSRMSDTSQLVKKILEKSARQNDIRKEVDSSFQLSLKMSENISNATGEQANTNRELLKGIQSIGVSTDSIVQFSESLAAMSQELKENAEILKKQIDFFKMV